MRAREFIIKIPISIEIEEPNDYYQGVEPGEHQQCQAEQPTSPDDHSSSDDTGTFVPPLQQTIELMKKNAGISSVFNNQ